MIAVEILVVFAVNHAFLLGRRLLGSLRLASVQKGKKRRRFNAAAVGGALAVPGAEEGDGDGSRAAEGGLAVDEVGDAAEGGGRGRRGGLRGRGGAAGAGAGVVAVGAEAAEAVAEAGGADATAPPLRGVLWAFPDLLFLDVNRHSKHCESVVTCALRLRLCDTRMVL